jgi:predicted acetyltransferase
MDIELIATASAHKPVLAALLELYQYDFTEFTDEDLGEDGRFGASDLVERYSGGDESRLGFLLRIDGKWAGLTLLHRGAFLIDDPDMMDIVEFFVMRKHRRSGAGEAMARAMFDRFPGRWEVRVHAKNLPGLAFWRTIIGRYTGGRFEERAWDDEKWRGAVQFFDSRERA